MRFRKKRFIIFKKKYIKIVVLILVAVIALVIIILVASASKLNADKLNAINSVASKGVIKVGLRGDIGALCTYNTEQGGYEGLEKDIIDEIISRLFKDDILVEYIDVNSETKDAMLKVGDIDVSLGASLWQDTSEIVYTSSYYSDGTAFLVMDGQMTSEMGLGGRIIAVVQGSLASSESEDMQETSKLETYLDAHGIDASVKFYASYPEAMEALRTGFVGGVCANEIFLKLYGKKGMLMLPERFMPNSYCIAVQQPLEKFRDVVDDTLRQMQQDGTLDALLEKWNLINYAALEE